MPEIISFFIPNKEEFVAYIVAGAGSRMGIGKILFLQFRLQLFVQHSDFYFILHRFVLLAG